MRLPRPIPSSDAIQTRSGPKDGPPRTGNFSAIKGAADLVAHILEWTGAEEVLMAGSASERRGLTA